MTQSPEPEKLVHLFDELMEIQTGVQTAEYKQYLIKWGVEGKVASQICALADPSGSGYTNRDALCEGLKCWPNQPAILKDVKVMDSDMSVMKRESVILLILEVVMKNKSKEATLDEIIHRLGKIYGPGWSAYIADGRYWAVCSHLQGSNLAFLYKNIVYGVYQSPNAK